MAKNCSFDYAVAGKPGLALSQLMQGFIDGGFEGFPRQSPFDHTSIQGTVDSGWSDYERWSRVDVV